LKQARGHALGRCQQGVVQETRPRVFHVMRDAAGDKDDGVIAVAKLALGLEPEPLRPRDLDKIFRESSARDLLGALDG
jgi:hypothetical protein